MTEEEWRRVQEALVKGGLRECIDNLLTSRPFLSDENRRVLEQAYDDGDGHTVTLVATGDHPWFAGMYDDSEVMIGMEYEGVLYSLVPLSGGGLVAVVVGHGLVENEVESEMGVAFRGVEAAKAYVKDLTAK